MPTYPEIPERLETERLVLRPPVLEDVPELYAALRESLDDLGPWMPWAKSDYSLEDCEANTRQAIAHFVMRQDLRYHFHDKRSGRFLVSGGLHRIAWQVPRFEIGYWCRSSEQGKGYVSEGVRALAALALGQLGGARVEICCDDANLKSAAVAERCGFTLEGVLRCDSRSPQGELRSTRVYAKFRSPSAKAQ